MRRLQRPTTEGPQDRSSDRTSFRRTTPEREQGRRQDRRQDRRQEERLEPHAWHGYTIIERGQPHVTTDRP